MNSLEEKVTAHEAFQNISIHGLPFPTKRISDKVVEKWHEAKIYRTPGFNFGTK